MTTATRTNQGGGQRAAPLRRMTCENCGHIWQRVRDAVPVGIACPQCDCRVCACGCGADLGSYRSDAIFASRAHAMALKRSEGATTPRAGASAARKANAARTDAPLQEVRDDQEHWKDHWSQIVYNGIVECLKRGSFHADDLEPLGIPELHRNLIGAQIGLLVKRDYITEVGRRKSANPKRKGAKSGVFAFTALGRATLAGVGAGRGDDRKEILLETPAVETSPDSGETPGRAPAAAVPPRSSRGDACGAAGSSAGRTPTRPAEARPLFEEPPVSAISDPRAA